MKVSLTPNNKIEVVIYILLLIILISINFVPKEILNVFDTVTGKLISLCVIIYIGTFNLRVSILLAFIYLLIISQSRKKYDLEKFDTVGSIYSHPSDNQMNYGDDVDNKFANWETTNYTNGNIPTSSNYCVPAGSEGCKAPYRPSENDPHWCAIPNEQGGAVRCIQKCPPRACIQKMKIDNSSGIYGDDVPSECPEGQITSSDDPNFCCTPKDGESSCSCDPWQPEPGCPKYTTCGQVAPPEEEKECPYVLVKQYKCPQPEAEMEMAETPKPEGCPPPPSCPQPKRGNDGELIGRQFGSKLPWLQEMKNQNLGINTTDPYIKQASQTLYKRSNPLPFQSNYDRFSIIQ